MNQPADDFEEIMVSRELWEEKFTCDISKCKGACCVVGDAGAPLEEEETTILEEIYEEVKPYIDPAGATYIAQNGHKWVRDREGDLVTPTLGHDECVYVKTAPDGTAQCGIELAWQAGKVAFRKPVSCQLFPVRAEKFEKFTAVNYRPQKACKAGEALGQKLNVRMLDFLEEALVRKYGTDWFEQLRIALADPNA